MPDDTMPAPSRPDPSVMSGVIPYLGLNGRAGEAAGCTVEMPFKRQFWGDRWGMLRDPFGLHWAINEPRGEGRASIPEPVGLW